ncbi:hypothetical protein IBTHAUMO2_510010 [Nitrosopumilaceae archaeon]|nr:hypothetical protein IBTHAUMO2_510010 [Nitrosopumilaceae archaeon]
MADTPGRISDTILRAASRPPADHARPGRAIRGTVQNSGPDTTWIRLLGDLEDEIPRTAFPVGQAVRGLNPCPDRSSGACINGIQY